MAADWLAIWCQATDYKTKFEPLLKKGATLGLSHGFLLGEPFVARQARLGERIG
jgi:hypothetical protein